jgi:hypothetical protein
MKRPLSENLSVNFSSGSNPEYLVQDNNNGKDDVYGGSNP